MIYRSNTSADDFHTDTRGFFAARRVLVLGGSGFIGSHVVEQLLSLKAEPVVVNRSQQAPFLAHLPEVERHVFSLEDRQNLRSLMAGCSVVIHSAAQIAGLEHNAAHPASMFMNNMKLAFAPMETAAEVGIERYLVTSSACVYPRDCSIPTPEEEGFLDSPEPTNDGYGWSKRMQEFLGQAAAREYGLSVAIARPYNAYGPRDNFDPASSHVLAALIRKAVLADDGSFPVWGDGSHSRSFLYVDDFARGMLEVAARYPEADAVNIGADEETTIREAAELVGALVSKRLGRTVVPQFDPAGLTGQPRRRCDTGKAERLLQYRAKVPLTTGLERTIDWYLEHRDSALPTHTL